MRNHIFRVECSILTAFGKFSNSSEENVTGTVQRGFAGIFKHTDDEAYTDYLHGNVIADAERGTSYGNQEK